MINCCHNRTESPDRMDTQTASPTGNGLSLTRTEAPRGIVARSPATLLCAAQINGDERTPVAVGTPGRPKRQNGSQPSSSQSRAVNARDTWVSGVIAPLVLLFGGLALAGPAIAQPNLTQAETDFVGAVAPQGYSGDVYGTVQAGYRVCSPLDKGMSHEGIERFVKDTFSGLLRVVVRAVRDVSAVPEAP
jgi:hypothetical protein